MYLKELSEKVWLTRNARFIAAKRMKRSRVSSTAAVAMLSASVIAVNLLAFIPNVSECCKNNITIGTIVLSTFALVMSLLITLLRYEWREDNYNQCGMELEELNQEILIRIGELMHENNGAVGVDSPKEDNLDFLEKYTKVLQRYNLNHMMFDYRYGRLTDSKLNLSWYFKTWMHIRFYVLDVWLIYWIVAIAPVILITYVFFM